MKILFFGSLGERIGREMELDLPTDGCTVAELRLRLAEALPDAARELGSPSLRACVDQVLAFEDTRVLPGREVAFIPPLSGG